MSINFFLFFPENDDNFFHLIENDPLNSFVSDAYEVISLIKDIPTFNLFYSSDNLDLYITNSKLNGLNNKRAKSSFLVKLQKGSAKPINQILAHDELYFIWRIENNFSVEQANNLLGKVYEKHLDINTSKNIIVNLFNTLQSNNSKLIVFKDSFSNNLLPEKLVHIDSIISKEELIEWITNNDVFSLYNTSKYRKIGQEYDGKPIFVSLIDDNYWYLDNFHKNHYEVFDKNGIHLGEADLNGDLNIKKRDSKKRIRTA